MNIYFRLLRTLLCAPFKPRILIGDAIVLPFRVWPNDLEINSHMNNGRYMTIVDLALIEYFTRAGLLRVMLARDWRPMLGSAMICYRHGCVRPVLQAAFRVPAVRRHHGGWTDERSDRLCSQHRRQRRGARSSWDRAAIPALSAVRHSLAGSRAAHETQGRAGLI
jgi:hypothetical protein